MDKKRKTRIVRLDEILDSNKIIIKLKNMKIKFIDDFEFIKDTHEFLLKNKMGPGRHRLLSGNIDTLERELVPFLDYDFDPDIDIDQLKLTARNILTRLDEIKKQIP
jgi:hypothetical protein